MGDHKFDFGENSILLQVNLKEAKASEYQSTLTFTSSPDITPADEGSEAPNVE